MKKLWPSNQSFNQTKYKCTFLYEQFKYKHIFLKKIHKYIFFKIFNNKIHIFYNKNLFLIKKHQIN